MTVDHDNAYAGLTEGSGEDRWAFGTGFDDPLAGIDTTLPPDVDGPMLARYCLMLGDDALIAAQRLSEWITRAPELEEEVAVANIALDLLGQARLLLARAAAADSGVVPRISPTTSIPAEDALAYFRDASEFRNTLMCELDNGDFAQLIVRLLLIVTARSAVFDRLRGSRDPVLAAIAGKGVKELTYHRDYAARWAVVLGAGTEESRRRTYAAFDHVWPYVNELFAPVDDEIALAATGVAVDPGAARPDFDEAIATILRAAEMPTPRVASKDAAGAAQGRHGTHTPALAELLTEMQSVARAHPEGVW
ncbi:1,2-phenylacetyl-CoA epoxidase subunit PaaC [Nocardia alni]|uniref:1,2-phenylacetyl-CoA epoxidase subunit PaaC n=1 Tax=Nocardia alni TaxID=2815723 RepID=UPI001C236C93|nr:1,2-phenylacetyl-CoA epoxidase subunit PaaC [Nocardia alni]